MLYTIKARRVLFTSMEVQGVCSELLKQHAWLRSRYCEATWRWSSVQLLQEPTNNVEDIKNALNEIF